MMKLASCSRLVRHSRRYDASAAAALSTGAANAASAAPSSACPFEGTTTATATPSSSPKLTQVSMLPYVGSIIPQYSGTPKFEPTAFYDFYPELRRRFGDFYKMGFPGLGKGRDGEMYVLTDPVEMQKVLRQERKTQPYPRGIVESEWPLIKWLKETGSPMGLGSSDQEGDKDGYMGRGETWRRLRTFLQTDMLSPHAAKGYIPGMVEAAELASKGAPASSSDLNAYTNRCSFDMFCSIMLGELSKMADPNTGHNPENVEFCNAAVTGMETMMAQMTSPFQLALFSLGIKTGLYKDMAAAFSRTTEISGKKYNAFRKRFDENSLTEREQNSYLGRAIVRQAAEDSNVSEPELGELIDLSLMAAIDTTSSLLSWNMVHLAMNPHVQDKLNAQLVESTSGGRLDAEAIKRSVSPYLHAVIRESHRLTPAAPVTVMKENSLSDVEIHGTVVPKGSLFLMDSYSIGIDPDFVSDPQEFQPERWLSDAVESRKGTPSDIIDHPVYKDPFSQGSRKCPGSRVASNEVLILLSQLVLDWKISSPGGVKTLKDIDYNLQGMIHPKIPQLEFTAR